MSKTYQIKLEPTENPNLSLILVLVGFLVSND